MKTSKLPNPRLRIFPDQMACAIAAFLSFAALAPLADSQAPPSSSKPAIMAGMSTSTAGSARSTAQPSRGTRSAHAAFPTTTATPVAPVANPCPRSGPGSVIQNPPALFSNNGVLLVRFSYQTRTDSAGRTLYCFMTPDGMDNPTLHVNPGDHLIITVTTNTPAGEFMMTIDPPNCGPSGGAMTMSSLNIHYHGTNTSPTCGSDEVIKTIINSGQTFQYNVAFPTDEPPGLYWYHPHVHGISEMAVLGGGTGAIVVDGIENVQPAVSGMLQRILVIRDQPTIQGQAGLVEESPGGTPNGVPEEDVTVNNISTNAMTDTSKNPPVTTYTPAILQMEAGAKEFWRVSNTCANSILDLQLQYDRAPQTLWLVSVDGVPVNSQDGTQPGRLIPVKHFRLPPASRVEFIVDGPKNHVKSAQMITLNIPTGQDGDDNPTRPLFDIHVASSTDAEQREKKTDTHVAKFSSLNSHQKRFAGLAHADIAKMRTLFFDEIQASSQFFMAVEGQKEELFDPNAPPAITATQGTVEEWTVQNRTLENHEFHIHQIHFLVESQNKFEENGAAKAPGIDGQYLDMIEVPAWDGNPRHAYPSVTLRLDFRGPDVGNFVFHCHILEHEDGGMMNIIQVVPADQASENKSPRNAIPGRNPSLTKAGSLR